MKLRHVVIENYRSIEKVELRDLGDFVVFYGPNGGGKSNILRAIACAFGLMHGMVTGEQAGPYGNPPWIKDVFGKDDFRIGTSQVAFEITLDVRDTPGTIIERGPPFLDIVFRCVVDDAGAGTLRVSLPTLHATIADGPPIDLMALIRGEEPAFSPHWNGASTQLRQACSNGVRRLLLDAIGKSTFHRSDDVRAFSHLRRGNSNPPHASSQPITELLASGRVEEAIARAATSDDDDLRDQFNYLRSLLTAPPLNLSDIEAVVPNNTYLLRVRTPGTGRSTVNSSSSSLGAQQIMIVLGILLFSRARIFAVEEPEAHLHAPTSGRALREVLHRLVVEKKIDQLLIATHSNLFDLDPDGFWSVRQDNGRTVAVRESELSRIDTDHLFEPGPAKRVLQDLLRHGDADQVVAFGPGGAKITAAQMLHELQSDSPAGVRYAQELSRAAARLFLCSKPDIGAS